MTTTPEPDLTAGQMMIQTDRAYVAACIQVDAAFGQMPYGGSAHFQRLWASSHRSTDEGRVPEPIEALAVIEGNLRRLVTILRQAAESNEADRARLASLDRLLAGAGELGLQMVALSEATAEPLAIDPNQS